MVPNYLQLSGFVDDHSVRRSFKANNRHEECATNASLEKYLLNVKKWMDEARLKMNPGQITIYLLWEHQADPEVYNIKHQCGRGLNT